MDDYDDEFSFGGDVADEDLMLAFESSAANRPSLMNGSATPVRTPRTVSTARTTPGMTRGRSGLTSSTEKLVAPASCTNVTRNRIAAPPRPEAAQSSSVLRPVPENQRNARPPTDQQIFDLTAELDDLPSDAFNSSFASYSGAASHSQRSIIAGVRNPLRLPSQQLFRQTTLFGDTLEAESTQVAHTPNQAFVLNRPPEKPTHHKIDKEAMKTWVYPTNLGPIRDYQFSIVKSSLFNNTLVALPTGLGKTFIAATVILNFYRWTKDAKMIFVAPTKPLVSQQVEACLNIAGIPRSETTLLTGETPPQLREAEWASKRLFFMTPQTLQNDLSKGYADPKSIALLVIDEAHRSTGDYAYVKVIGFMRRFTNSFRVLALTATPGSSVEAVQEVIDNLGMSHVEIRTEESMDIRQYVHSRDIERLTMEPSSEMKCVQDHFSKALQPFCDRLTKQGIWFGRDPMSLNTFTLMKAQNEWTAGPARHLNPGTKFMILGTFTLLKTLAHSIKLLNFHGIKACYDNLAELRAEAEKDEKGSKNRKQFFRDPDFQEMMMTIERWMREDGFESHPKLTFLKEQLYDHFKDQAPGSNTRAIVFNEFRDSAEDIVRSLNRDIPNVKASIFVGQADSKRSAGMKQKAQIEAIEKFKSGEFNVLVATSIGEEGLDIGQVDLIICYDASSSPIRMLQRMGRTGRKRAGRVLLLLMKGKEENKFAEAQDKYSNMQKLISDGSRFNFRYDLSDRIVPREIKPEVDKRHVEIPIENTQDPSLPEPRKPRGKLPKASKKKFHMPDDAETGFVAASAVGEDGQTKLSFSKTKAKGHAASLALPDPAEIDSLVEIPDHETALQASSCNRGHPRAAHTPSSITAINAALPDFLQFLRPCKYLHHGKFTKRTVRLMSRLAEGSYDRPRSQGLAYMRHRVPAFAPHTDGSEASDVELVHEPPSSKSRSPFRSVSCSVPSVLPTANGPVHKRRCVTGPASAMTERARLTPVGYVTSHVAAKRVFSDEDDEDERGSSKWQKSKARGSKSSIKGMTRQRSSQFQSYSFGGASVKSESPPDEDDGTATTRQAACLPRAGSKRASAVRAPLPKYNSLPQEPKPIAQRIFDGFSDGDDDLEEPDQGSKSGPRSSAARKKAFDLLDDDVDDGLDGDLALDVDLEMADAVQGHFEDNPKQPMQEEAENLMDDLSDDAFADDIAEIMNEAVQSRESPKAAVSVRSSFVGRPAPKAASKFKAESPPPQPPQETELCDILGISQMSDTIDFDDILELPNFPKPREKSPCQSAPRLRSFDSMPRQSTPVEDPGKPEKQQPVRCEQSPCESPLPDSAGTPSVKSSAEHYIVRFSQPAGTGASLRGVRRGRNRGQRARGGGARGSARGRGGKGGDQGFSAITEESDEREINSTDELGGRGGVRGGVRGRARGQRGRGSRGGGAGNYGRLEERGDDCMRTSDNYETDGSDSGGDLADFVVGDDEEVSEEAPTSSFTERILDESDVDELQAPSSRASRKRAGLVKKGQRNPVHKRRSTVVFTSSPAMSSPPPAAAQRKKSSAARSSSRSTVSKLGKSRTKASNGIPIRLSQTQSASENDDDEDIFARRPAVAQRGRRLVLESDSE